MVVKQFRSCRRNHFDVGKSTSMQNDLQAKRLAGKTTDIRFHNKTMLTKQFQNNCSRTLRGSNRYKFPLCHSAKHDCSPRIWQHKRTPAIHTHPKLTMQGVFFLIFMETFSKTWHIYCRLYYYITTEFDLEKLDSSYRELVPPVSHTVYRDRMS